MTIALTDRLVEKAERLLTEGKVSMAYPVFGPVALVTGETGEWTVFRTYKGRWLCTCPAFGICSHLTAVALVTGTWEAK